MTPSEGQKQKFALVFLVLFIVVYAFSVGTLRYQYLTDRGHTLYMRVEEGEFWSLSPSTRPMLQKVSAKSPKANTAPRPSRQMTPDDFPE